MAKKKTAKKAPSGKTPIVKADLEWLRGQGRVKRISSSRKWTIKDEPS